MQLGSYLRLYELLGTKKHLCPERSTRPRGKDRNKFMYTPATTLHSSASRLYKPMSFSPLKTLLPLAAI